MFLFSAPECIHAYAGKIQSPKPGLCGSVVPANMPRQRQLYLQTQFSKLPRQTQDGGASAGNALSHGARMLLVNLSLINKAERKDNNKYWTYLAYIHSKGVETKTGPSGLKTAWP